MLVFEIEKENEELASNHAMINTDALGRIGDWRHHPKEAVLLKNHEGRNITVELLKSIPGVGQINAATIAAHTEDMSRFEGNFKRFAAYVGIVPGVRSSNEYVHLGRITKHGPEELGTAFVQVALGMIRLNRQTSEWYLIKDYRKQLETV